MDVRLHEGLLCARVGGRIPKVCLLCGATKDVVRRTQEYPVGTSYGAGAGAAGGVAGAAVASTLRSMDRAMVATVVLGLVAVVSVIAVVAHRATPKVIAELPLCQRCDGRWAEGESYRLWVLLAVALFFALVVVGLALDAVALMGAGLVVLLAALGGAAAVGMKERFLQIAWVRPGEIGMRVPDPIAKKVIERAERRAKKGEGSDSESDPESGSGTRSGSDSGSGTRSGSGSDSGSDSGSGSAAPDRARVAALALSALALVACSTPTGRSGDAGRRVDAVFTEDAPGLDAASSGDEDSSVHGMVVEEICTNGVDEDRNGSIDDGCPCAVGTRRACWPGPPDMRTTGACADGEQTCDSDGATAAWSLCAGATMPRPEVRDDDTDNDCDGETDEAGAICEPSEQQERACDDGRDSDCDTAIDCDDPDCRASRACETRCAAEETVCWGEVDDDCDMQTDCDDPDCATDPSCRPASDCPPGQVTTYRQRELGASAGASSIAAGDGAPPMSQGCEDGTCPPGQVRVVLAGGRASCVPPPPECPEGRYANYVGYASWECDPPCEVIVHYGGIYGGLNVCTERPRLSCPAGQSPTFVFETQTWVCRTTCNNTLYDQVVLDGQVVCIPC